MPFKPFPPIFDFLDLCAPVHGLQTFHKKMCNIRDFGKTACRFWYFHINAKVGLEEAVWGVYENGENPKLAKMGSNTHKPLHKHTRKTPSTIRYRGG